MTETNQMAVSTEESNRISLPELADELQCHKQTLFKVAKRLNINPTKQRDIDRKNQLVSTITLAEAQLLRDEITSKGRISSALGNLNELGLDEGVFYLIQLEPDHDPGRIKLGFTTELEGRLRKHRCSAPFAISVKSWPCRRTWERAAMDCITVDAEQIHTEIFRVKSIMDVIEKADKFFAIMPSVNLAEEIEEFDFNS